MKNLVFSLILLSLMGCSSSKIDKKKYYNKDNSSILFLKNDSLFTIQDYNSTFNSNGSIQGKYRMRRNVIQLYDLIDRNNLSFNIGRKKENFNIEILAEDSNVELSNIDVLVIKESEEKLLGKLKRGVNYFETSFKIGDTLWIKFKYNKEKGLVFNSRYSEAMSGPIIISSTNNLVKIVFNVLYFDLKSMNEIEQFEFNVKGSKFY